MQMIHIWMSRHFFRTPFLPDSMTYLRGWGVIASFRLQLNSTKTEVMCCASSRRLHQVAVVTLRVGADNVMPDSCVRDLEMHPWRHTSPELRQAVLASCVSCRAFRGRCLVMPSCHWSAVLCWRSWITVTRCSLAFQQNSWIDFRPSSTQHLG